MLEGVESKIDQLFEGKVGSWPTNEQLKEWYQLAQYRYDHSIPPGYEDERKPGLEKYGDAILWFQIMEYAKAKKTPIVFITSDKKKDWFVQEGRLKSAPRPELIQEIMEQAGVLSYIYLPDMFMKLAGRYLQIEEKPEVIQEVREVSEAYTTLEEIVRQEQEQIDVIRSHSDFAQALQRHQAQLSMLNSSPLLIQTQQQIDMIREQPHLVRNVRELQERFDMLKPRAGLTNNARELQEQFDMLKTRAGLTNNARELQEQLDMLKTRTGLTNNAPASLIQENINSRPANSQSVQRQMDDKNQPYTNSNKARRTKRSKNNSSDNNDA